MGDWKDGLKTLIQVLLIHGLERTVGVLQAFIEQEEGGGNSARRSEAETPVGRSLREYLEGGLAENEEEVSPELSKELDSVPMLIDEGRGADADHAEIELLRSAGALEPRNDRISTASLRQFLTGLAAAAREAIGRKGTVQGEILEVSQKLTGALQEWREEDWAERLRHLAFMAGRAFPFWLERLNATQAYQLGQLYYQGPVAVVFSNTSGLLVPLERFGNSRFVEEFPSAGDVGDALMKNPERVTYFKQATLNDGLQCVRHYQWDERRTAEALYAGYALLRSPDDQRKYIDTARQLFQEALAKHYLQLSQCSHFDWWKRRFTRNAHDRQLLSNRGGRSKHICHAITVDISAIRSTLTSAAVGAAVGAVGGPPILIAVSVMLGLTARGLDRYAPAKVFERYFRELENGETRLIKQAGVALTGGEASRLAGKTVEDLMTLGEDIHRR